MSVVWIAGAPEALARQLVAQFEDERDPRQAIVATEAELDRIETIPRLSVAFNWLADREDGGLEIDAGAWERSFDRIVRRGLDRMRREAIAIGKGGRGGTIINCVGSTGKHAAVGQLAATAHHRALVGLSMVAAKEWAPWNVRVHVVCADLDANGSAGARIAETAHWLALSSAAHLTGQIVEIDGARNTF